MTFARIKPIILLFTVLLATTLVLVQPTVVQAEETTCDCYCAVPGYGAKNIGQYTSLDCQQACSDGGANVAACAFDSSQLPSQDVLCFAEATCSNQKGKLDKDFQPPECLPGMYYCYPTTKIEVTLNVAIGETKSLGDYGEYIEVMYKWLLGVTTLFAIVMVLIGGLQYTLAAGGTDTSKAKKRIQSAVMGLVLLIFAYAILFTVNPQLVKLTVPKFPMIRTVTLLDKDSSCGYLSGKFGSSEYLQENGARFDSPHASSQPPPKGGNAYEFKNATNGEKCGSIAEVVKDWEGNDAIEGSTCVYDYCAKVGSEQPQCVGTGEEAKCLTCKEVGPNSVIAPDSSVCSSIGAGMANENMDNKNKHDDVIRKCFYTRDPSMFIGAGDVAVVVAAAIASGGTAALVVGGVVTAEIVQEITVGTCAAITIDCNKKTWCGDYDNFEVYGNNTNEELDELGDGGIIGGDYDLRTLCEADPCGLAPKVEYGAQVDESCKVVDGDILLPFPFDGQSFSFNCKNAGSIGFYNSWGFNIGVELNFDGSKH